MASHVIVIDSALRRHTVKTTPGKHLSDVLQEACNKFGLSADQYGLKHNNKPVDLSRTIRLSGLSSGAKLELTQASRSPSVVSIALQVPTSGASTRLTNKFPSNTSVWQILRRFESGVAGEGQAQGAQHNFTQRATPVIHSIQGSGSGRMCFEMPVVNIMGRELSTFTDLQKTMAQLGYNGGNVLLRLSFKATDQPLEEAMASISQYFKEVEDAKPAQSTKSSELKPNVATTESKPVSGHQENVDDDDSKTGGNEPVEQPADKDEGDLPDAPSAPEEDADPSPEITPGHQPITFYAPPSSNTPMAASVTHDEQDYTPSIAHAEAHQARLLRESRNKKLPTDNEAAAEAEAKDAKLASIARVAVRIRFPDQSQALREFSQGDTVRSLYDLCEEVMYRPSNEEFQCRVVGEKGSLVTISNVGAQSQKRLIRDLGWKGRVLVTVVWVDSVGGETRQRPVLKEQYRKQAEQLKVDLHQQTPADSEVDDPVSNKSAAGATGSDKGKGKASDVESKMKKFLGMGKKK